MAPAAAWKPRLRDSAEPRYVALIKALATDIGNGTLRGGDRLPTQRELASATGLALGTITRAYAAAESQGLIRGEVGRGTFVRDLTDPADYSPQLDPSRIDLGPAAVPIGPGDIGQRSLQSGLAQLAARADLGALCGYQAHAGTREQRESGKLWLAMAGVEASAQDIVLCNGAQHATAIVLAMQAARAGVMADSLTYPGLLSAAKWLGVPIVPLAMDEHGMTPEALDRACDRHAARALYCMPTGQNPTGTLMSASRRREIVRIARARGITIFENGALAPLAKNAPLPVASLAPERTIYISTLSKAVMPALRTGFIHGPPDLMPGIEAGLTASAWSSSPLLAELSARWIRDGIAEVIRDARRAETAARFDIARQSMLGRRWSGRPDCYFAWIELPAGVDALDLVRRAEEQQLLIGPAHLFAASRDSVPNAIRISLGAAASRETLARGLTLLTTLIDGSPS